MHIVIRTMINVTGRVRGRCAHDITSSTIGVGAN